MIYSCRKADSVNGFQSFFGPLLSAFSSARYIGGSGDSWEEAGTSSSLSSQLELHSDRSPDDQKASSYHIKDYEKSEQNQDKGKGCIRLRRGFSDDRQ